ncbi:hypothetical protein P153DRAFT_362676 [Dothidotthia symphoricarpi CBS 119687]|uniref:Uncharacterized protein n=1 Tax=Dothidotthia symphoricarpi CBS 119687 TaxID=1392245 RepID=A0A6A6AVX4_9PLEO|nr:uncharacterized protein P153DRAFT_362676 [Dothidotthia symphoricarpi CBS 119687]KAF2134967.1 hypothetical protein P153DRAFT_362676 [Dothidotthia symphoricarpi CBS 119687]
MTKSIQTDPNIYNMPCQECLPAKYVSSPARLIRAVAKSTGEGRFYIEMRHNMYFINSYETIDVKEIVVRYREIARHQSSLLK